MLRFLQSWEFKYILHCRFGKETGPKGQSRQHLIRNNGWKEDVSTTLLPGLEVTGRDVNDFMELPNVLTQLAIGIAHEQLEMSREDIQFMQIVGSTAELGNGHYYIDLPFREERKLCYQITAEFIGKLYLLLSETFFISVSVLYCQVIFKLRLNCKFICFVIYFLLFAFNL